MIKLNEAIYLSEELNTRMKSLGLKKWYVAYYCEIGESNLAECIRGERLPNPWQLILMAEVFGCTVNDLLGHRYFRKEDKPAPKSICMGKQRLAEEMWDRIRLEIERQNLNIDELADSIYVKKLTFLDWLKPGNTSYPKTITLLGICRFLNCTPSDLLGY